MAYVVADPSLKFAPVRAPDSLTQQQMTMVLQTVEAQGSAWQVDQIEHYLGYSTIIVTAADSRGDAWTFVVSGRVGRIELASMFGDDDLCECGCFSTIEATTAALVAAMSSTSIDDGDTCARQYTEQHGAPSE